MAKGGRGALLCFPTPRTPVSFFVPLALMLEFSQSQPKWRACSQVVSLAAVFVSSRNALCDETKTAARESSSLVKEENTTSYHPHHTKSLTKASDSQLPINYLFDIRIYKLWGQ